jgi:hypothetical protein
MNGAEAFELKHDTASVYSMDSAYQSQKGASRRAADGYPQDSRSRVSSQLLGGDLYSPTLSSETLGAFQEQQHSDISQMQLPSAAGDMDAGDNSYPYANFTTGQDFTQFTATSIPPFTTTSNMDMAFPFNLNESQAFAPQFSFTHYPKSTHSFDNPLYSSQEELMFNIPAPPQRQMSKPRIDTSVRPTALRNSSSYNSQSSRRQSANEVGFPYVMSPTSAISAQLQSATPTDFEHQQSFDARAEKEETASTSLAIDDEDELLSPSDAAELKSMEEEQGKVARSHPLYQAQPDDSGKYHCPKEGQAGCNHKPTPLKCNYE